VEVSSEFLLLSHALHISLIVDSEAFLDYIVERLQIVDAGVCTSLVHRSRHSLGHLVLIARHGDKKRLKWAGDMDLAATITERKELGGEKNGSCWGGRRILELLAQL
jgi:hypothetical protein